MCLENKPKFFSQFFEKLDELKKLGDKSNIEIY